MQGHDHVPSHGPTPGATFLPQAGLDNMRDPGILDPRHFFSPRHFYTIYAIFTRFYAIFTRSLAIFALFFARHLKLLCRPAWEPMGTHNNQVRHGASGAQVFFFALALRPGGIRAPQIGGFCGSVAF